MSGLLYCISGIKCKPSAEDLKNCGMEGCVVESFRPTETFISGTFAVVFTIVGKTKGNTKLGFWNSSQHWVNKPNTNLYVGYNLDEKPKADDFLKSDYLVGHDVLLGDENKWIIPIARKFHEGCILPKTMLMLVDGELQEVVVSKYLKLQKIAEKLKGILPLMFGEDEKNLDLAFIDTEKKIFDLCLEIINFNYSLSYFDVSVLELFNTSNMSEILKSVVDGQYIEKLIKEELEKKRDK